MSGSFFNQGTGEFPLPLAGQPGREHGGNGLLEKKSEPVICRHIWGQIWAFQKRELVIRRHKFVQSG